MTAARLHRLSAPTIGVLPAEVNADIAGRCGRPLRRRQRPRHCANLHGATENCRRERPALA
jgi:hypothetical protein